MNISGKFGSNLFSGFREEDLNVKSLQRTTDEPWWQKLTWPLARWAKKWKEVSPIRYIDKILTLNNFKFGDFVDRIYPIELEI